jgi:hypothetical protein
MRHGGATEVSEEQPMRKLVTPLLFSAGLVTASLTAPATAAPVPVTTATAIAGDSTIDQVHYRRYRRVAYGPRFYHHRRYYGRRYYNPAGAAFAGAALGLFGTALAAAATPSYYYYPSYYAYPAYYPAYYGGWGYPYGGYRRAYWGGGYGGWGYRRAYWGGGYRGWGYRRWR